MMPANILGCTWCHAWFLVCHAVNLNRLVGWEKWLICPFSRILLYSDHVVLLSSLKALALKSAARPMEAALKVFSVLSNTSSPFIICIHFFVYLIFPLPLSVCLVTHASTVATATAWGIMFLACVSGYLRKTVVELLQKHPLEITNSILLVKCHCDLTEHAPKNHTGQR